MMFDAGTHSWPDAAWLLEQSDILRACADRWAEVIALDDAEVESWEAAIGPMSAVMRDLQQAGQWVRGGTDLLTIVGLNRWELAHSAALAWLLDPYGTHRLGDVFLRAFVGGLGVAVEFDQRIEVRVEEQRITRLGHGTRADVVIASETWTLVIEVKVDAGEGQSQAARLYECWSQDPDPAFVFLTRGGHAPVTVDDDCRNEWIPVSWKWVAALVADAVASQPQAPMRALEEYSATLIRMFS